MNIIVGKGENVGAAAKSLLIQTDDAEIKWSKLRGKGEGKIKGRNINVIWSGETIVIIIFSKTSTNFNELHILPHLRRNGVKCQIFREAAL